MIRFTLFLLLAMASLPAFAQYEAVVFNYEKSLFNNGKPLPAETYFELQGDISGQVTMVEVNIFSEHGFPDKQPIYTTLWKRPFNNQTQRFQLPINYNLRSGEEYDLTIGYFRKASPAEKNALRQELFASLDAYIDQNINYDRKRIRLIKDDARMVEDMNTLVRTSLGYYRNPLNTDFPGFSDLVEDQIEQVEESKQSRFLGRKASMAENLAQKEVLVQALKTRVHSEVSYIFNTELHVLADRKVVDDYRTEDLQGYFTLHGGYGGAYLESDDNNNSFGRGFMAGITLPLAKKEFSSPFWSRTSIMAGVYFNNFDVSDEAVATGPLLGRPYYLGAGFKFYRFLRISAGATLLENQLRDNVKADINDKIYVRPFVSLTADINLFIGLAK